MKKTAAVKKNQGRKRPHVNSKNLPKSASTIKQSNNSKLYLSLFIGLFAFLLYSQTIKYDYTLDDHKVIDQNTITTKGLAGIPVILSTDYWYGSGHDELRGPIYRPAPMVLWSVGWEISPNNPHLYHFMNVLFYSISCLILFLVLCELFASENILLPFICTLLFTAHPIHTEVVNNIKSLDEILCFLFGIGSIGLLLKYSKSNSKQSLAWGGLCFFLSLVSKETGIAFLLIIPLTLYYFSDLFKKSIFKVSVLLVMLTALWLIIRFFIFKDLVRNTVTETSALNNTLYAAPDLLGRYATAFYILLRYVGLLIFPHPLTCDYNFAQINIQTFSDPGALLGILIYVGMGIYALINIPGKKLISFAILFYLVTLAPVSNIFFLGGSSMAERFLYTPSLGFCLIASYALLKIFKTDKVESGYENVFNYLKNNRAIAISLLVICTLYSIKTYSRSKNWKDTLTIYSHDIHVSGNSATANELLGNYLILQVAHSANKQNQLDTFNIAKAYLKRALEIAPGFYYASTNLGYIYLVENKPDSAYYFVSRGIKYGPQDVQLNYFLGSSLLLLKKYDEAITVFNRTVTLNPKYEDAYKMLANAYMSKGDVNNGLATFYKLLQVNPGNGQVCYTVGEILKSMGDVQKGNEFLNRAKVLGYHP